jgi:hypothetical protein
MSEQVKTSKQLKLAQKIAGQEQAIILELQSIVKDIERSEKTISALKSDLENVNTKHASRKTTQDDVNYLEDLLACAKKKLVWEKHMASLQKRTPELMQRVETLVNHPESSPDEKTRAALLEAVLTVKSALERLQGAKL